MTTLHVNASIQLEDDELEEHFIHSPGPGGQHVNKAATGVQLRFDVQNSPSLPEPVRERLTRLAGKRITKDGILVIEAHRFRSLGHNRQEAQRRLFALIRRAAYIPKERVKTRPPHAAIEQRLQHKRRHSQKKQGRLPPEF
ncbi:MAG: aminoacyl-tRNA hydrolase [Anaerolineales bacterium]|nr:MAG: aminoacyl-tRNA hydrolase [Anaerolineales bacterium]